MNTDNYTGMLINGQSFPVKPGSIKLTVGCDKSEVVPTLGGRGFVVKRNRENTKSMVECVPFIGTESLAQIRLMLNNAGNNSLTLLRDQGGTVQLYQCVLNSDGIETSIDGADTKAITFESPTTINNIVI